MRRLARSNLVVERSLNDDYEVLCELKPGDGERPGGQGRVLKVRLLGAEAGTDENAAGGGAGAGVGAGAGAGGGGAIKVLKELRQADMRTLLKEALVPHLLLHPLLVKVDCVFFDHGHGYVQTDYYECGDLHTWLFSPRMAGEAHGRG